MKLFVRKNESGHILAIMLLLFIVLSILPVIYIWKQKNFAVPITIIMLLFILTVILYKWFDSVGLYIDGKQIYYKGFFKKNNIDATKISGIKVVKAVGVHFVLGILYEYDLKDNKGNQVYTVIFLKEVNKKIMEYIGDDWSFFDTFREYILFDTVYNSEMIHYFKILNPDIMIIDNDNITGRNEAILSNSEVVQQKKESFLWCLIKMVVISIIIIWIFHIYE